MSESTTFDEALEEGQIRILLRLGNRKFGLADQASEGRKGDGHEWHKVNQDVGVAQADFHNIWGVFGQYCR
jgi:hypothetical protein